MEKGPDIQPKTKGKGAVEPRANGLRRNTVEFLGVKIDNVDTGQLLERILFFASTPHRQRKVMYVNADCMVLAQKNPRYMDVLNGADLVYPDGAGVVLGARLLGLRLAGRSTAADFMPEFAKHFARAGLRLFLLGARPGVAKAAAKALKSQAPNLLIAGTHHGYFKKEETRGVIQQINASKADILLVGFGAPFQEFWIEENAGQLTPTILWGVGGLFDFLSGRTPRGPRWMLDHGLEWLCRLAVEPRRLWRRYLIGNLLFLWITLKQGLFQPGKK